jgi:hypothetical protein
MTQSTHILKTQPTDVYVITSITKEDDAEEADICRLGLRVIPLILVNGRAYLFYADIPNKAVMTSHVLSANESGDVITFETRNTHYELTKE